MKLRELFFPYDHRPEHNKALDGLRGWAVLLVLFGHATNQGLSPWLEGYFLSRGKLGVYLFFIISAYLLDKQIIQVWQQGRGNASYWRYYIGRRIMRIFPPFIQSIWLTNLFILALGVFIGWGWASDDFTHSNVYIPAAILWGILLLASFQEGVWRRFLSFRPFRFVGAISYSLYLFHIPVLMWVKSLGLSNAIALPAFLSLSIAVAALLHLLVERPALSLVKK